MTRQTLISLAQSGDGIASERPLVECQSDARRYAMRQRSPSGVEDAVQEALITRHVSSPMSAAPFAGRLLTRACRKCARLSRRMLRISEELTISETSARLDVAVTVTRARLSRAVLVREYLLGTDDHEPAPMAGV